MTAPERFRKWRQRNRILLGDIAGKCGLSVAQVSALECGRKALRDIPCGEVELRNAYVPDDIIAALAAHEVPECLHENMDPHYLYVEPQEHTGYYDVCCTCGDVDWESGPRMMR